MLYPITSTGEFSWKNIRKTFDELNREGNFRAIEVDGKIELQHKYREQEVLKNVWIDKKYQSEFNGTNLLKDLIGENDFSYPKSLYAVMDIVKIMSGDGDIVLDFFGGSGTTAHAVWQANAEQNIKRRFIICEQLEDHIRIMQQRLLAVLKQEKMQNNSFVSCELAKLNQNYVEEIEAAQDGDELGRILERMLETGFVSYKADLAALRKSPQEFETLPVNDKKRLLMDLLDKNQLYINYCDIDDEEMAVSEADKAFTRSFYGVG